MSLSTSNLDALRRAINENLRIQRGGAASIDYVDVSNALADSLTRHNHVIFGRRGCGKTLLLLTAQRRAQLDTGIVYINCEDYKQHTFPNVLVEILDGVFAHLARQLTSWFGKKRRLRSLLEDIRRELEGLKERPDQQSFNVRESSESCSQQRAALGFASEPFVATLADRTAYKSSIEKEYAILDSKIGRLNMLLPRIKERVNEFFNLAAPVKAVFIQLDDYYHLPRFMQPHVTDYVHRLCKDVPLYFKIATLRHSSQLYADRGGQPTGAQERHDYQPINVDFTLAEFQRTSSQLRQILHSYARLSDLESSAIDGLFMGEGFGRLVLASGGVPRDFLSLLLEILSQRGQGERIGKDDVRLLSLSVWQRRIEELKADSQPQDQDALLHGIYAIRTFCTERKHNAFLVADRVLQEDNGVRELLNRLADYRIIHFLNSTLTHKTRAGTFTAYMIDIGAYANLRKLAGRFAEIDIGAKDAREQIRNAPVLDAETLAKLCKSAPADTEAAILADDAERVDSA